MILKLVPLTDDTVNAFNIDFAGVEGVGHITLNAWSRFNCYIKS